MKTLKLTLIFFSIWFVDFLTTFISLNFLGLVEGNPFPRFFYQFWWGWIVFPIITFVLLFLIRLFINFCSRKFLMEKKITNKIFLICCIGTFFGMELVTIIGNIILMIPRF